jgi:hypothetical protein
MVLSSRLVLLAARPRRRRKSGPGRAFPEPEEELYGVTVGGKMYVMEGFGSDGVPVGMVWEYDPATDKWTKKKKMALPAHHVALVGYNNKIYAFGGYTLHPVAQGFGGWTPIDNAWEYDPSADTWKAFSMPPAWLACGSRGGRPRSRDWRRGSRAWLQPTCRILSGPARSVGTNEVFDLASCIRIAQLHADTAQSCFGGR